MRARDIVRRLPKSCTAEYSGGYDRPSKGVMRDGTRDAYAVRLDGNVMIALKLRARDVTDAVVRIALGLVTEIGRQPTENFCSFYGIVHLQLLYAECHDGASICSLYNNEWNFDGLIRRIQERETYIKEVDDDEEF